MEAPENEILDQDGGAGEVGGLLKCMACCSTKHEDFLGESGEIDGPRTILSRFCKEFLAYPKVEEEDNLSLCVKCCQRFSSVLETRTTVDAAECRVRSLQMSILCEMKQLQQYLNVMEEQFKEIEESVINSVEGEDRNFNLHHFREKILSVAKDLRNFQAGLSSHLVKTPKESQAPLNDFVDESVIVKTEVEDELEPGEINPNSNWLQDFISTFPIPTTLNKEKKTESKRGRKSKYEAKQQSLPGSLKKKRTRKQANVNSPSEEWEDEDYVLGLKKANIKQEKSPGKSKRKTKRKDEDFTPNYLEEKIEPPISSVCHLSPQMDDPLEDNFQEEEESNSNSGRPQRRTCRVKLKSSFSFLEEDDEEDEDEIVLKKKKPKPPPKRIIKKADERDSDYEPDAAGLSSGSKWSKKRKSSQDEDEEESGNFKKKKKIVDPATLGISPLENVDVTEMEPFKRCMVVQLLERPPIWVTDNEDEEEEVLIPGTPEYYFQEYKNEKRKTWFEYDPVKNGVHYKGVDVVINEEEKSIQCSVCPFKMKFKWPPPRKGDTETSAKIRNIRQHIPRHYFGYECPFCPPRARQKTKKPYNINTYLIHLRGHCSKQRYICEVCCKGWHDRRKLEKHLLIHKSKEERKEIEDKRMFTGSLMCEFCPRAFDKQMALDGHLRKAHPGLISSTVGEDGDEMKDKKDKVVHSFSTISLERKLRVLELHFKNPHWKVKSLSSYCTGLCGSTLKKWKEKYAHFFKDGKRIGTSEEKTTTPHEPTSSASLLSNDAAALVETGQETVRKTASNDSIPTSN